MTVQGDAESGTNDLKVCSGQLLASNHEHEHTQFDGEEDSYRVGGLAIELEGCPHRGCRA